MRTYTGVTLLTDDEGALDKGGARVVDAVEHRLLGLACYCGWSVN